MPFGLFNAPATFQPMINEILKEFLDRGVVNYIDNFLSYSKSIKKHRILVRKVLEKLRRFGMAIFLENSIFHVKSVDLLGYVAATDGVTMNDEQVRNIKAWKPPTSVKEVQIFLGFGNLYQRFIKRFSAICTPITDMTKADPKKKFIWQERQQVAFEKLKRRFTLAPILCHFHPGCETVVVSDASDPALG